MPRPKQRTPELRDRVLHVAVSTLNQDGLSGFTTRRVAELAGTSVPAVYELFQDKSGLVRSVFFEGFAMREGLDVMSWLPTYHDMGLGTCIQALFMGGGVWLMSPLDFVRRSAGLSDKVLKAKGSQTGDRAVNQWFGQIRDAAE